MSRGILAAVSLLAGTVIMSPVAEPADPPKPPYTDVARLDHIEGGKVLYSADVWAVQSRSGKWSIWKNIKVRPAPGSTLTVKDAVLVIQKATLNSGTGAYLLETVPGPPTP